MSRVIAISLSSLLLVGLVAMVSFGLVSHWGKPGDSQKLGASTKAVQAMCQPTDYKEACFKSLGSVKTDDPKELVRAAFESAKAEIREVAENSTILKELAKDPKTAEAVKDCKELFEDSIDDLQRSFDEIGQFEWDKVDKVLGNLKAWLSATITYQETCIDGFENTTGDAGQKVRKILQTAKQMSSNGLAIVNDMSSLLGSLDMSFNRRRLLSIDDERVVGHDSKDDDEVTQYWLDKVGKNRRLLSSADAYGAWNDDEDTLVQDNVVNSRKRKLLSSVDDSPTGHDANDDIMPDWINFNQRKLLEATNLSEDLKAKANVVVAQDGSGKYKTIEEALNDIPKNGKEPFIIYIKEGVYNEYLVLFKWMTHVVFVGDGPTKTRITNNKNFVDGTKTFKTATLSVLGDFFMAKDIGIENSAGAIKHQAVALRVQSDQSIFFNCHMDGYQDTLYTHTYRQFYRDCRITGTIDFIFGDAAAFFQNCTFVVRKPLENQHCIVTAQGRLERHQPTGIIIHRSRFQADPDYYPLRNKNRAFLGRPWKEYSKTIIMESEIDDLIQPDGWLPWEGDFGLETCYYGEYNNVGSGSSLANRVKWRGIKTIVHSRAEKFMPPQLYENDAWIRDSGIPYDPTLSALAPGVAEPIEEDEDPNAPAAAPSSHSSPTGSDNGKEGSGSSSAKKGSGSGSGSSSAKEGSGSGSGSSSAKEGSGSGSSSPKEGSGSSSSNKSNGQAGDPKGATGGSQSSSNTKEKQATVGESTSKGQLGDYAPTVDLAQAPTPYTSPSSSPSPTPSLSPSPTPSPSPSQGASLSHTPSPSLSPSSSPIRSPSTRKEVTTQKKPSKRVTLQELERILMANDEMEDDDDIDMTWKPDTPVAGQAAQAPTLDLTPISSPSTSADLSPSPSPNTEEKEPKIVTVHDLERLLMSEEDVPEDEQATDDMSGNVPDGDEPSPAMVQPPSPAPSPSVTFTLEPPSVSPAPSSEELSDWLPPAAAPAPDTEVEPADNLPPTIPPPTAHNAASQSKYNFHVIFSGMAMLAALAA